MIVKGRRTLKRPIEMQDFFHFYNWATHSQLNTTNQINRGMIPSLYHPPQREWQQTYINRAMPEAGRSMVIEADGQPIGQINYHEINRVCNAAHFDIFIAEDATGGKELEPETIRTLVDYLFKHMDIDKCEIEVPADNLDLVEAYRKIGFTLMHSYKKDNFLWQKMELYKSQLQACAQKAFQAAS